MASCAYCNTTILFGGKKRGDLRFCNDKCEQNGELIAFANQLPQAEVDRYVRTVHAGDCPSCGGEGPVDVHTSYRVYSAVLMTSWSSRPAVSCKRCATRRKLGDAAFSAALGWWGLPWGLIMTPVQIGRNLVGLARSPDPSHPSDALSHRLRVELAARQLQRPLAD